MRKKSVIALLGLVVASLTALALYDALWAPKPEVLGMVRSRLKVAMTQTGLSARRPAPCGAVSCSAKKSSSQAAPGSIVNRIMPKSIGAST